MTAPAPLAVLESLAPGTVRREVPLARYTSFKVGGPAEILVEPRDDEEVGEVLRAVRRGNLPFFVLGGGTNLLVRDGGVRGVVLRLGKPYREVVARGEELEAGASATMARAAAAAEEAGLEGLEFGFDIPGTVGGALRMNAGAHGSEVRLVLKEVVGRTLDGIPVRVPASEIRFSYRRAVFPAELVFLRAVFSLRRGDPQVLAARRREYHDYRLRTQPKGNSVGSVFVNPEGDYAGRLIEAAGLKGHRVGGAVVSTKHANWILSETGATARDIERLMEIIRDRVRDRFKVELHPEVRIVGEPRPGEEGA